MAASDPFYLLGDELLAGVLALLAPADLAVADASCRRWRRVSEEHGLWQRHAAALDAGLRQRHVPGVPQLAGSGLSWKQRWLELQLLHVMSASFFSVADPYECAALRFEAHPAGIVLACAAAGGRLATGSTDRTARVWDLDTLRLLHTLPHPDPVLFVSFLGPDTLLTATTGAGYVWRAGRLLRRMADDSLRVGCATAWDVHLATGMADGSIRIYDVYSGALSKLLRPHSHAVSCLAHAAQGDRALLFSAASGEESIACCDADTSLQLAELRLPGATPAARRVTALAVSSPAGYVVAATEARERVVWSCGPGLALLPTPLERVELARSRVVRPEKAMALGTSSVTALAVPGVGGRCAFFAGDDRGGLGAATFKDLMPLRVQDQPLPAGAPSFRSLLRAVRVAGPNPAPGPAHAPAPAVAGAPNPRSEALARLKAAAAAVTAGVEAVQAAGAAGAAGGSGSSGGAAAGGSGRGAGGAGASGRGGTASSRVSEMLMRRCSCICADGIPLVTGHQGGHVVLWSWQRAGRRRPQQQQQQQ